MGDIITENSLFS